MNPTNRVFKSIQNYVCSDDDFRPAMQGMAIHGQYILATDGHKAVVVEMAEDVEMPESGILKFDTKQALNADFHSVLHEYVNEQYPKVSSVFSNGFSTWDSENRASFVDLNVNILNDTVTFLKKLNCEYVSFYLPEYDKDNNNARSNKAVAFLANEGMKANVKQVWGIVMPSGIDKPMFDETIIDICKKVEDNVNNKVQTA